MRKAVIRESDGFVENIIEIEEGSSWTPPENCYLIDAGNGSPGDTWDGEKFVKSIITEPEPPLVFEPPETGIPEKVEYIEHFLKEIYKEE